MFGKKCICRKRGPKCSSRKDRKGVPAKRRKSVCAKWHKSAAAVDVARNEKIKARKIGLYWRALKLEMIHYPVNAILDDLFIEVDQKGKLQTGHSQVCKRPCKVHRIQFLDRF